MQKTVRLNLDEKELKIFEKQVKKWGGLIDIASKNIVDDLSKFSAKKMENIHNSSPYKDNSSISFVIEGNDYQKKVSMVGEQALYDEFGTGTRGGMHPHPMKGDFDLNDYNSGKTIRINKSIDSNASKEGIPLGTLYWTYYDNGEKKYTQGIPAEKAVYDSAQATIRRSSSTIKKEIKKVLEGV